MVEGYGEKEKTLGGVGSIGVNITQGNVWVGLGLRGRLGRIQGSGTRIRNGKANMEGVLGLGVLQLPLLSSAVSPATLDSWHSVDPLGPWDTQAALDPW